MISFGLYSSINYNVKNNTKIYIFVKNKIPSSIKRTLRNKIQSFTKYMSKDELVLEKLKNIENKELGVINFYNNKFFNFTGPRAYIASNNENFFLITGSGLLFYSKLSEFNENKDVKLKEIKTNILEIFDKYKIDNTDELEEVTMVKSILVHNEKVYFSATVKLNEKCYKQKIFKSELNLNKMNFTEFFQIDECRTFYNNTSGGNITIFKDNKILYTLGDWKACQYLDKYPKIFVLKEDPKILNSTLGKIISINLDNKKFKYLSTGHNNPQGITYDETSDIIFSAEHGPQGGDEVNVNNLSDNRTEIKNFGWPTASYGEHYGYPSEDIKYLYEMAPLLKSHKDNGFVEPLDYFCSIYRNIRY